LAVRGYIKIEEEAGSKLTVIFSLILLAIIFTALSLGAFNSFKSGTFVSIIIIVTIILFILKAKISKDKFKQIFQPKEYKIKKAKDYESDSAIEEYEKEFLNILFEEKNYFSTKEMKRMDSNVRKQKLFKKMQELKGNLLKEAETATKAYDIEPSREKIRNIIISLSIGFLVIVFGFLSKRIGLQGAAFVLALCCIALEAIYFKYEARLNKEGELLKDDWLGFKLYLETAEKYRLQNLTPDLFEKYLPYAIIFGIEKQWAKNFDALNLKMPDWYQGNYSGIAGSSMITDSFSPSSFASSFSASFSSSFGSSGGAGGAGGGGGGAGGGGGGGGGGAS
jgi:uncharacterized membrane protein